MNRNTLAICILLLAACSLPGCGGDDAIRPSPETQPQPGRVDSGFITDLKIVELALPEAISRMHWGALHVTNEITALHAAAVTDNDRPIDIRARKEKGGRVVVQVKVGFYGDADAELEFLKHLNEQLDFQTKKLAKKAAILEGNSK